MINNKVIQRLLPLILVFLTFACCTSNKQKTKQPTKKAAKIENIFAVKLSDENKKVRLGDSISFSLISSKGNSVDSIILFDNSIRLNVTKLNTGYYKAATTSNYIGNRNLSVIIYHSGLSKERHVLKVFVLPNIQVKQFSFKVIKKFDHDINAYTQGLFYHKGYLYESTGRRGQSSLRKIDAATGVIEKKRDIEPQFFGEGITLVKDEIFMLTYVSQVGFVFDLETFDLKRTFNLQTREGWGLTTYEESLLLSDGSPYLYYFAPEYFNLTKQIEVCDYDGLIPRLNELEYTPWGLLANVYGENYVVIIDPQTGIVTGKIDFSELFPEDIPKNYDYVLNGIAFNNDKQTFYVTGKQWPALYEVAISID